MTPRGALKRCVADAMNKPYYGYATGRILQLEGIEEAAWRVVYVRSDEYQGTHRRVEQQVEESDAWKELREALGER